MPKACNWDNVAGRLMAEGVKRGQQVGDDILTQANPAQLASFTEGVNEIGAHAFDNAPDSVKQDADKKVIESFFGKNINNAKEDVNNVKDLLSKTRNPSGLFGEETVDNIHYFIADLHEKYGSNIFSKEAKKEYFSGIQDVFESIGEPYSEASGLKTLWSEYKDFHLKGGELYNPIIKSRGGLEKVAGNVIGNTIKSSANVIVGNLGEGAIKLPTFYPKELLPAFAKLASEGPAGFFKEIPEAAAHGVYGLHFAGEEKSAWQGLIGITDIPLKNLVYTCAEIRKPGSGAKGVQDIAFTPRFGDLPMMYYSGYGRAGMQLMSYTVNSYKMYFQMWKGLKDPSTRGQAIQQLVTYHALAGLLGGAGGMLPAGFEQMITTVFPDTQDWFDEHKTFLTPLIQPGNINRIGVGLTLTSDTAKKAVGASVNAIQSAQEGDFGQATISGFEAAFKAATMGSTIAGDVNLQKAGGIAFDVIRGEVEPGDTWEVIQDRYNLNR